MERKKSSNRNFSFSIVSSCDSDSSLLLEWCRHLPWHARHTPPATHLCFVETAHPPSTQFFGSQSTYCPSTTIPAGYTRVLRTDVRFYSRPAVIGESFSRKVRSGVNPPYKSTSWARLSSPEPCWSVTFFLSGWDLMEASPLPDVPR